MCNFFGRKMAHIPIFSNAGFLRDNLIFRSDTRVLLCAAVLLRAGMDIRLRHTSASVYSINTRLVSRTRVRAPKVIDCRLLCSNFQAANLASFSARLLLPCFSSARFLMASIEFLRLWKKLTKRRFPKKRNQNNKKWRQENSRRHFY